MIFFKFIGCKKKNELPLESYPSQLGVATSGRELPLLDQTFSRVFHGVYRHLICPLTCLILSHQYELPPWHHQLIILASFIFWVFKLSDSDHTYCKLYIVNSLNNMHMPFIKCKIGNTMQNRENLSWRKKQ